MINKIVLLCGLSMLAACGGGGSGSGVLNPSSSSSSTSAGKFIYVPNLGASSVTAYSINKATGALTAIPGTPFQTGATNNVSYLSVHPSGNFLYASNNGSTTLAATLSAFAINSTTGLLSLTAGSPYLVGMPVSAVSAPDAALTYPDGRYVYVRQAAESKVFGYAVNQTSGVLTPTADSPLPYTPLPGKFNSITKFYYAPLVSPSNAMGIVAVDIVTGIGTLLGSVPESQPLGIPFFDPTSKYLYSASAARVIFGYSVNTNDGSIAKLPGSPYPWPAAQVSALPTLPPELAVHPSGKFVYVLDPNVLSTGTPLGNSNITIYSVDQATGALAAVGSPVSTGGNFARGLQLYKNGQFLLATNRTSDSIAIFSINATTGALTAVTGSPFATPGTTPGIVTIDPSERFAYATDYQSNTISVFTIDANSGKLTAGANYPTGSLPSPFPLIVGLQ